MKQEGHLNRNSLSQEIARKTKLSKRQAENLVIAFGAAVTQSLEAGEKVIYSNFGSFYVLEYPSKTLSHPKSGQKMVILPTRVVKFMPSDTLKKLVNSGLNLTQLERYEKELLPSDGIDIPIAVSKSVQSQLPSEAAPVQDLIKSDEIPSEATEENKQPGPATANSGTANTAEANPLLQQAHIEDDIEKYHQHKEITEANKNVYEEILSDGSSELSTIEGTIKLHKEKEKQKNIEEQKKRTEDDNLSPLDLLKRKLGLVSKSAQSSPLTKPIDNVTGKKSEPNLPALDRADDEELQQSIDSEIKPKISLATVGIFDKSPQEKLSQPVSPPVNKIEEIKEELKKGSGIPVNNEAMPQPANKEKTTPLPGGPLFSGVEGAFSFDKARIEYKDLSKIIVPKELLAKIPENIARSYKSVVFEKVDNTISVAMVDPEDIETREMLKRLLGEKVKVFLATESDINAVLSQYQGLESEVSSAIASANEEEEEKAASEGKTKLEAETISDDAPAAKIVSSLLKRAIRDKASDIHIEPTEKEVEVRFRLDGVLRKKVSLPKDIQAAVISRIKILSNLKIDEQRIPQDGRFNMQVDNRRVDFRVSSMPIAFGEKIVMRILDKDSGILTIEELGIGGSGLKTLEANLTKSHGMILVTGPTGSGKSTTLYAMIQKVFNEGVNIITLEDPIEYQMRGINQSQVNSDIGYTFAAGLRSILRQDPDIIMLGEIRDKETAEMAVHAALTGHVVLSTLHTNDAAGAAPRMIDMGVEPFLLTSSINVVIGQRLVRKICTECKEEVKLPDEEIAAIRLEMEKMPAAEKEKAMKKELKFFKGKGCKSCDNSGYKGRIGIYEVLGITPEMQQLILKRVSSDELNNLAISQGMVTMIQDGILKAIEGVTTMEEIWRATKN